MRKWQYRVGAAMVSLATVIIMLSGCGSIDESRELSQQNQATQQNKEENTMQVINVNKNNFQAEVMESDKTVLLDFWAPWCGPCRMVGPILEEIAAEREDVKVCKVNVDEEMELASQYGIVSIPTLLVIENGQIVNKSVGAKPKADILAMLP